MRLKRRNRTLNLIPPKPRAPARSYRTFVVSLLALAPFTLATTPTANLEGIAQAIRVEPPTVSSPVAVTKFAEARPTAISRWPSLQSKLENRIRLDPALSRAEVTAVKDGLEIRLPGEVAFNLGESRLKDEARTALQELAQNLAPTEGGLDVTIENHSDLSPIIRNRSKFRSNWELSAARAASLVMIFEQARFPASQLMAVGMTGERRHVVIRLSEGHATH